MVKKKRQYREFDEFVIGELSKDSQRAKSYLETALKQYNQDNDEAVLLIALKQVAQAQGGFSELSKKTGLTRESLYRSLSAKGNPRFSTLTLILNALGYNLQFKPLHGA